MSLVPNIGEAERFLNLLKISDTDNKFEFVSFHETDKEQPCIHLLGSLDRYESKLVDLNEQGRGIFVTINCGSRQKKIYKARAIWLEDDGPGIVPELAPSFTVESSPNKFHHYWLIDGGTEDFAKWQIIMNVMVSKYKSDNAAKDLKRVLRIPGFYHQKSDPFRCKLNADNPIRYDWGQLCEFFLKDHVEVKQAEEENTFDPLKAINDIISGTDFHASGVSLAMRYANKGLPKAEMIAILNSLMTQARGTCDEIRWKARVSEIPKWVNSAITKLALEKDEEPAEVQVSESLSRYTSLSWPPGFMGVLAKDVHASMKFPNKEIAILTAHIVIAAFSGRKFSFEGNHIGCIFRLHARTGTGKSTPRSYINRLIREIVPLNPTFLEISRCLPPGDSFGLKTVVDQAINSLSYVAILSEGGITSQSKAGDQESVRAFFMDQIAAQAYDPLTIRGYSKRVPTIYGVPTVRLIETVKESDVVAADRLVSGEAAREFKIAASHKPDAPPTSNHEIDPQVIAGICRLWTKTSKEEQFYQADPSGAFTGPTILPVKDPIIFQCEDESVRDRVSTYMEREYERRIASPEHNDHFTEEDEREWANKSRFGQRVLKIALYQAIADACASDNHVMTHSMLDYAEQFVSDVDEGEERNASDYNSLEKQIMESLATWAKKTLNKVRMGSIPTQYINCGHKKFHMDEGILFQAYVTVGTPRHMRLLNKYAEQTRVADKARFILEMGHREGYWKYYPNGKGSITRAFIQIRT